MSSNFYPDVSPNYGGLMSASVSTAQCSEISGTLRDDLI